MSTIYFDNVIFSTVHIFLFKDSLETYYLFSFSGDSLVAYNCFMILWTNFLFPQISLPMA